MTPFPNSKQSGLLKDTHTFEFDAFLSFSSHDSEAVSRLWNNLTEAGLEVFWSDVSLKENLGDVWYSRIEEALEKSQHFILIASKEGMESKWVQKEFGAFQNHCMDPPNRTLIPVLKDLSTSSLPLFMRDLQVCAFDEPNLTDLIVERFGQTQRKTLREALEEANEAKHALEQELLRRTAILTDLEHRRSLWHEEKIELIALNTSLQEKCSSAVDTLSDLVEWSVGADQHIVSLKLKIQELFVAVPFREEPGLISPAGLPDPIRNRMADKAERKSLAEILDSLKSSPEDVATGKEIREFPPRAKKKVIFERTKKKKKPQE